MEIFVFNSDLGNEAIDAFNQRLYSYCTSEDQPIGSINASSVGAALVLSVTSPDDVAIPQMMPLALMPLVRPILYGEIQALEDTLTKFCAYIRTLTAPNGAKLDPVEMRIVPVTSPTIAAYAVAVICLWAIDYED